MKKMHRRITEVFLHEVATDILSSHIIAVIEDPDILSYYFIVKKLIGIRPLTFKNRNGCIVHQYLPPPSPPW